MNICGSNAAVAVRVDEVGCAYCHPRALVGRVLEGDVEVQAAAEVDDPEGQEQDDGRDQGKLGEALRALALGPSAHMTKGSPHGLPWMVKCSLYPRLMPAPNRLWMKGVMSWKFISSETLMSPSRQELSGGAAPMVPVWAEPPGYV